MSSLKLRALFQTSSVQYLFVARNAPQRAIVVSNLSGNYQLHSVDFKTGFHRQITHTKSGALFGSISPDGQYIYILKDENGNEHGHFVRIPFSGGKAFDLTPNFKPYFSYSMSSSDDGKTLCFSAALENKNRILVTQDGQNGVRTTNEIYATNASLSEPICSSDGVYVCVAETSTESKNGSSLLLISSRNNEKTLRSRRFGTVTPLAFSQASARAVVLALARTGEWLRPIIYDFTRNHVSKIQHRSFRGDVWVLGWNEACGEMVLCDVYHAEQKLYLYNIRTKQLRRIGPKIGGFNFHFNSAVWQEDGSFILKWHDFNTSPRLIHIHAPKYDTWNNIPEWSGSIVSQYDVKNVWVRSSDGNRVQMLVARPRGITQPIPFVIDIHGGPHGVSGNEFSPAAQAWLESGFGYCTVNYRGSIGFGKKFERKIYGNPGYWEVEDVVAAQKWLVQNAYTSQGEITLYGWSWGGYVTLLALGKYPDLWRCGIAGAAIADCIMQYEDESEYFKAQGKKMFKGTPNTARTRYVRSSPITYVDRIRAPILLLHGENDVRCPPRQIKHFVYVLQKSKKRVLVEWFTSGHIGGFTDTALRAKLMYKVLRFAIEAEKNTTQES